MKLPRRFSRECSRSEPYIATGTAGTWLRSANYCTSTPHTWKRVLRLHIREQHAAEEASSSKANAAASLSHLNLQLYLMSGCHDHKRPLQRQSIARGNIRCESGATAADGVILTAKSESRSSQTQRPSRILRTQNSSNGSMADGYNCRHICGWMNGRISDGPHGLIRRRTPGYTGRCSTKWMFG